MGKPMSRRVLTALAAASLAGVLSVQATVGDTDASLVDDTFARGTFMANKWNIQGNASGGTTVDSGAWTDHPSGGSPAIFQPTVGTVVPGATKSYSRFGLRMAPGSSTGATVTIPQGVEIPAGKADKFRMRVVRSTLTTCNAGSFVSDATFIVGSATPTYGNTGMKSAPNLGAETIGLPSSGAPVFLCYEFSLPSSIPAGLNNGDAATVSWTFNAVSS